MLYWIVAYVLGFMLLICAPTLIVIALRDKWIGPRTLLVGIALVAALIWVAANAPWPFATGVIVNGRPTKVPVYRDMRTEAASNSYRQSQELGVAVERLEIDEAVGSKTGVPIAECWIERRWRVDDSLNLQVNTGEQVCLRLSSGRPPLIKLPSGEYLARIMSSQGTLMFGPCDRSGNISLIVGSPGESQPDLNNRKPNVVSVKHERGIRLEMAPGN